MKDKYKELDYIFSKENKYKDEDDIPMKLNEKQQRYCNQFKGNNKKLPRRTNKKIPRS